jgi:hypothetical protein
VERGADSADLAVTTAVDMAETAETADPAMRAATPTDLTVKAESPADQAAVDLANLALGSCILVFNISLRLF